MPPAFRRLVISPTTRVTSMTGKFGFDWLFSQGRKTRQQRSRRRASRPLRIEMLESKLPLAGNIAAAFAGGILTLTGDAANNSMYLTGTGGVVRVMGLGTLVNGAT